jgi:hypothetical protein
MTMTLSSRSVTPAAALVFAALTVAACSAPFPAPLPLDLSAQQYEAIGWTIAMEFESGAMQLTAQDALGTMDCCSRFSQARPGFRRIPASKLRPASGPPVSFQMVDVECGVASQDPPTDSDADQVPDNLTITFALPACRFEHPGAPYYGTYELTGVIRLSDPQPGAASMAFNMALNDDGITSSQPHYGTGSVRRDGLGSVVASAAGLSQTLSWRDLYKFGPRPDRVWDFELSAIFAPADGTTITVGQPLPDGTYAPSGAVEYRDGNRSAQFTVTTVEPLQYSVDCAAQAVANGYGMPFMSGHVRVFVTNGANPGHIEIGYSYCGQAVTTYVPGE